MLYYSVSSWHHFSPFRVVMQATPGLNINTQLSVATDQQIDLLQGDCGGGRGAVLDPPPLTYDQFRIHGFDVDWCQYSRTELPDLVATNDSMISQAPPTPGLATPTQGDRSYLLIVIAVVVCTLIFISMCALSCICFSRRKKS